MDDLAERKETNNGRPSRQKRNEKWTTQPKGKKRKMDDPAERKETKNGRPSQKEKRKMDDLAERKETKNG